MHTLIIANTSSGKTTPEYSQYQMSWGGNGSLKLPKPWHTSEEKRYTIHPVWQTVSSVFAQLIIVTLHCPLFGNINFRSLFYDTLWRPITWVKPLSPHCSPSTRYTGQRTADTFNNNHFHQPLCTNGTERNTQMSLTNFHWRPSTYSRCQHYFYVWAWWGVKHTLV